MLIRRKQLLTLAATMAVAIGILQATAAQAQVKPLAVVTLGGYDALIQDIDFIGSLAGQEGASQQIEMMIAMFTQNKGLTGLDKTRPLGVVILSDGVSIQGAVCVPVDDLGQLLTVLAPFGVQAEDQGDGNWLITASGQTIHARAKGKWAFLAPAPQFLTNLPDNPGTFFSPLTEDYDLAIRAFVQNIPEQFRQMAVMQLSQSVESSLQQLPGEEGQAYQLRKKVALAQIEQLTRLIEELDEVTFGVQIDGKQQRVILDVAVSGIQGSALAAQIDEYSDATTNYSGFSQPDAAMMLSFASKITQDEIGQFNQMSSALEAQIIAAINEEAELPNEETKDLLKSAMTDFLEALHATINEGMMDGGAVLTLKPEAITLIAGGFVGDPAKVESGLKKLAEVAVAMAKKQEPTTPNIEWNSASHGDVAFHTVRIPIPEHEKEPRQLFGESLNLAVGIGGKSVYFAVGQDCVGQTKKIIDASQSDLGKSVVPMEMTLSLGQIMAMAAKHADQADQAQLTMLAGLLTGEARGSDHIRLVAEPISNGLRYRLEVEEGVLKAIGMAAKSAQSGGAGF